MSAAWQSAHGAWAEARQRREALIARDDFTDEDMTNASCADFDRLMVVFRTPSPTVRELAIKIEALAGELEDFEPNEEMIALLVADAQRLAREA